MDKDENNYIVGLGEALWDMLPEGSQLGGAPANFAYHAAQHGLPAMAVSALGQDELGEETLRILDGKGLRHEMPRVPYPTGTVRVTLSGDGIPSYEIRQGVAWDNIPYTDALDNVARHAAAVCWGSLAQRSPVSRATIGRFLDSVPAGCLRIFDINLRQDFYTEEILRESMRRCDILKINDEELETLAAMLSLPDGDAKARCRAILGGYGPDMVVLTCGVAGSYVFTPDAVSFRETPRVVVADTVGAGDSFTGTFCAALLRGRSVAESHALAVNVSAYVCTCHGAMPVIPPHLRIK